MAQINSYPIEVPATTDLIPFSDVSKGNVTKSATVQSIANLANAVQLGYTSLVQLLTQTGTNAFTVNKTVVFINTGSTDNGVFEPRWSRISDTVIEIVSSNLWTNGSFEVKIYN